MKKPKIKKMSRGKVALVLIILLQFVLIAVLGWYLHLTRNDVNQQSTVKISSLINKAVDALVWPVNTDPRTGQVYIKEARLTLPPAKDHFSEIAYNYMPPFADSPEEVNLIDKNLVTLQEGKVLGAPDFNHVISYVPKLQACARGYQLFFAKQTNLGPTVPLAFSKTLQDGRAIYVYLDNQCQDNKAQLVPYLKQIQSY